MNKHVNAGVYSYLLGRCNLDKKITTEDVTYMLDDDVSSCQIELYKEVIKLLACATPYEEILKFIDGYNSLKFSDLYDDQVGYIKNKVIGTINARKNTDILNCQDSLYLEAIRLISEGKSSEEICKFIDLYVDKELERLTLDEKEQVKIKIKREFNKK